MREPRRDHYIEPATGADTRAALDAALDQLASARNLDGADPATVVHLLASLATQTETRISAAIIEARHDGCSWAGIADLLGVTRASAWQRWAGQERRGAHGAQQVQPASAPEKRPATARTESAGQNLTRSRSTSQTDLRARPTVARLIARTRTTATGGAL